MQKVNFILKGILLLLKDKAKDKGFYERERNSGCAVLICIFLMMPVTAYQQEEISANINIEFVTTVTLEQLHHPLSSYSIVFFDLRKHLYDPLDSLKRKVDLSLNDLLLSAPNIQTSAPLTAVVTLGYREKSTDATVRLINSVSMSLTDLRDGPIGLFTKTVEFEKFSEHIKNRDFNQVFFVIQIQFSGEGNLANYGLGSIDADLRLEALAETKVKIK